MALKISFFIALLGFLPLLIVWWKRRRIHRLVTKGDIVTGTVLEVYKRIGYKGSVYYQALIEYPVFNQRPEQGTYSFSGKKNLDIYYKGNRIEICYDKKKPKRFVPKQAAQHKVMLVVGIVFAVLYIVLSFFLYDWLKGEGMS